MESTRALVKQLMEEEKGKKRKELRALPGKKTVFPAAESKEAPYDVNAEVPPKVQHIDPSAAARDRARRRHLSAVNKEDLNEEAPPDIKYDNDTTDSFFLDGIEIVPFNCEKEREDGYLDWKGDFVYYFLDDKEKDPWLESLQVDDYISASKYARKSRYTTAEEILGEDKTAEVTTDIGELYSRIGNLLKERETVSEALRRLKGNSGKAAKMRGEARRAFDQLTDDATAVVGWCCDVYDQKKEFFETAAKRH